MVKKRKITVTLDCDDVLYLCNSLATKILTENGYTISPYEITLYGPNGKFYKERLALYGDEGFVSKQTPAEGAREFIKKIIDRGCDVVILTAVPPHIATLRMQMIMRDFPEIKKENIIIGSRKDLVHVDILVDDAPHNILHSQADWPILFRKPWNQDVTGLLAANDFDELLNMIDTIIIQNGYADRKNSSVIACLVAPSGSGKTKVIEGLKGVGYIVPEIVTTSEKRRDYYNSIPKSDFESLKDQGFFVETTSYAGDYYGIPCHTMMTAMNKAENEGRKIVIPLDICGANALKKHYGEKVKTIYIKRDKQGIIENILNKQIPDKAKILRILALDSEEKNELLCDESVSIDNAVEEICYIMGES